MNAKTNNVGCMPRKTVCEPIRSQCSAGGVYWTKIKTFKKCLYRQKQQGAEFLFPIVYLLPHLKDLAVLRSRQDPVGSPADAANRQTWRRRRRRKWKRRENGIRSAYKYYVEYLQKQQGSCNKNQHYLSGYKIKEIKDRKKMREGKGTGRVQKIRYGVIREENKKKGGKEGGMSLGRKGGERKLWLK